MRATLILVILLLLPGCCKKPMESVERHIVVNREVVETIRDTTIYVQLPVEEKYIETADTVSYLATSLAESRAIVSNGVLSHSLRNTASSLPSTIQIKEVAVRYDSLIYQSEVVVKEVEKVLTRWQHLRLWVGGFSLFILAAIIVGVIIYLLRHKIPLLNKFIKS